MNAHTPGEWKVEGRLVYTDEVGICDMNGTGFAAPLKERHANARLISAAPDLLEALEGLVRSISGVTDPDIDKLIKYAGLATAAIAKAKGTK